MSRLSICLVLIAELLVGSNLSANAIVNGTQAVGSNFVVATWIGNVLPQAGCTGAYLRPRVVVTGAHCVIKDGGRAPELKGPSNQFYVSQPGIDLKSPEARQTKVRVLKIWTEPDYFNRYDPANNHMETQVNDVAFLFLEKELDGVPLTRAANREEIESFRLGNETAFHLGYGMNGGSNGLITENDGKPYLVEGIVGTTSHPSHIPSRDRHLNVTYPIGKSLAPGDSGSPLMMKKGNEFLYLGTLYAGGGWVDLAKGNLSVRGVGAVTVLWPFVKNLDDEWIKFLNEEASILKALVDAEAKVAADLLATKAAEVVAAAEKKLKMENAIELGQFYREITSCHSNSIVAQLQSKNSGNWQDVAVAMGWIELPPNGSSLCFQPWTTYKASEGELLRWRLASPGFWEVFSEPFAETTTAREKQIAALEIIIKQESEAKAAAGLKAKQEADAKAAAELKAKQEADAKAAMDKSINLALEAMQVKLNSLLEQITALNAKLASNEKSLSAVNAKLKKICSAKPKPKGC